MLSFAEPDHSSLLESGHPVSSCAHCGLMPSTSSQIFMNVNMSTLVGMEASWALVKWNSELASVMRADKQKWRM